jgi:hypothetical protein
VVPVKSLKAQIAELARCAPSERIDLREPILAHGAAAIAPLSDLASADPELGPSVTAWLEVLANRDEEARTPAVAALRTLVTSPQEDTRRYATEALGRLGVPVSASRAHRAAAAKS